MIGLPFFMAVRPDIVEAITAEPHGLMADRAASHDFVQSVKAGTLSSVPGMDAEYTAET